MFDALVVAMEAKGALRGQYYMPDRHTLYAALVLAQQVYPKVHARAARLGRRRHDHAAVVRTAISETPRSRH